MGQQEQRSHGRGRRCQWPSIFANYFFFFFFFLVLLLSADVDGDGGGGGGKGISERRRLIAATAAAGHVPSQPVHPRE
jgi:hypothetical protein